MFVKIHCKPMGIPPCRISASADEENDRKQVTVFISALDALDHPSVACSLRLSVTEARHVVAQLRKAIKKHETP